MHSLATRRAVTLDDAAAAYLATLAGPESAGTRRVYSGVLRALAAEFDPARTPRRSAPSAWQHGSPTGGASGRRPRGT